MVDALKSLVDEDRTEELEKSKRIIASMDPRRGSNYIHLDRIEKSDVGSNQLGNDQISCALKTRYKNIWIQLAMVRMVPQGEIIHIGPNFLLDRKRMDSLAKDRESGNT